MPLDYADPRQIRLTVAGPDLRAVYSISNWHQITSTLGQNTPASGQLTVTASPQLVDLIQTPGMRIHLTYAGQRWQCGPIEQYIAPEQGGVPGEWTIAWSSDLRWLAGGLTYPVPTAAAASQTSVYYAATGNVETVLRDLVDLNRGPSALTARQVPGLVLGDLAGVGSSVTVSATMSQALSDVMRDAASAGGGVSYDIVLRANPGTGDPELAFTVWAPRDVSRLVRYSHSLRNLSSLSITSTAPTATVAIVGQEPTTPTDGSPPVPGTIIERFDADTVDAWGRMEKWVATTADATALPAAILAQMQQDGDLALLSAAAAATITADVLDTPKRRYGDAYRIGDTVAVQPALGPAYTDTVTGVKLTADSSTGVQVAPVIGSGNARSGQAILAVIRDIARRMAQGGL